MKKAFLFFMPLLFMQQSIYTYSLPAANGGTINLNDYQGKKILLVNTAINSEYANQYGSLQDLYNAYHDSLVIIAVPSNSFGHEQETDSALYDHLTATYDADYLIAGVTDVAGDSIAPLYEWLTQKNGNGVMSHPVNNDFEKFLIDGSGKLIGVFSAGVDPMSDELREAVTGGD